MFFILKLEILSIRSMSELNVKCSVIGLKKVTYLPRYPTGLEKVTYVPCCLKSKAFYSSFSFRCINNHELALSWFIDHSL